MSKYIICIRGNKMRPFIDDEEETEIVDYNYEEDELKEDNFEETYNECFPETKIINERVVSIDASGKAFFCINPLNKTIINNLDLDQIMVDDVE